MLVHDVPTRKFLPTLQRAEPLIKDHTSVQCFMTCKRKYFYRMVLGRAVKGENLSTPLNWGSTIHKFIEIYSTTWDLDEARKAAGKIYREPGEYAYRHLDLSRLAATFLALKKFLDDEKSEGFIKTLAVEAPFNLDLPDGSIIGGRIDADITFAGQYWVRDWKGTTKPVDQYLKNLDPNDQATRYVYARSRLMGWDPKKASIYGKAHGIEYVIISNEPDTKTTKKKPKIEKRTITKSPDQLVSFERQQMFQHKAMEFYRQADEWPMEYANCSWCDYLKVCTAKSEENMEMILRTDYDYSPWDHQKVDQEKKG